MNIIVKKLKFSCLGIRRALMSTFIINLVFTSILLMFAFGLSDVTNETLSENDLDQVLAIISSIISVAILCICFLQWIIGIEIKALFRSRKEFNINMRLMGVSGKSLGNIYLNELLSMQYIAVPISLIFTFIIYAIISIETPVPWISVDKILAAIAIHLLCIFISMKMVLRKLVSFEVATMMRGQSKFETKRLGKVAKGFGVLGGFVIIVSVILDKVLHYCDIEILYIIGILMVVLLFFYHFSKWIVRLADRFGLSKIGLAERIQLGNYRKTKNSILMLSIGLMLFFGLQSLFISAEFVANKIGNENIHYAAKFQYKEPQKEQEVNQLLKKKEYANGLNYTFYIEESSYPKHLHGIEPQYLSYETILLDNNINQEALVENLDSPDWNGILLPKAMIGKNNIGETMELVIEGQTIPFVIVGGYSQNVFHQNIWFASKSYIQKQLGLDGYCNTIYAKESEDAYQELAKIGAMTSESKQKLVQDSVDKVIQSTEVVEITSLIVVICAIVGMISNLILESNENIKDIAKLRSSGMGIGAVIAIYMLQLSSVIIKGYVTGILLAYLFAKLALNSMLAGISTNIEIVFPYSIAIVIFIMIHLMILITFYLCTQKGYKKDFTLILRRNDT